MGWTCPSTAFDNRARSNKKRDRGALTPCVQPCAQLGHGCGRFLTLTVPK
jgi:hypothetical protein